jgi:multidrug efflux pump subunit AcrA (membrane-fusion protein)
LMTGMYVGIEILAKPRIRLLRLPRRAVQPGNTVWVVKDGELTRKRVRPANTDDDNVILYYEDSGLQEGDVVVVSPLVAPTEGTPVHVRDES